ncbi:hypothetical protein V2H22_06400 [Streptococcus suis]|uniref:hypothetical protein n=1 Tax=Streptococcus suis TaxID=1307 RepID=UPI00040F4547|nr:hypothetical protein [Streptococcus suis]MCB2905661.1 hypothetical protein [Streptococcus suis]MDS1160861.1 hypothetical protein [Streptococcus suis]MEE3692595.1 hypothetical protein [Streptococcus suis]MEE3732987.1 hypothetical protein [Streptococcus suis]HEL1573304.1 hypothetical protein [Streptococcus suis]
MAQNKGYAVAQDKKYYVSVRCQNLDIGLEVLAKNQYMAAIKTHICLRSDFNLSGFLVTEIEEVANDK